MKLLKCLFAVALTLVLALGAAGCGQKDQEPITSFAQLGEPGRRIGVPSDMPEAKMLEQDYPQASIIAYEDYQLAYQAVKNGQLDAFVYARREMEIAMEHGVDGVRLLDETYSENTVVVGVSPVSPIPGLRDKINAFLAEKRADGTLDEMFDRWVIRGEDVMPDIPPAEHPTLRLRVATTGTVMPYTYFVGTELRGYDIELAYRFAAWLGAEAEFKIYDFLGIITAAAAGDVDCIMSDLFYQPEAEGTIPFSDPLLKVEITAMVRDTDAEGTGQGEPLLRSVSASFEKTFLRENRWMLFAEGVMTTLLITVLSILSGTALGFAVFMLCRGGNRAANAVAGFFVRLVQGMPVVVLLMILYYVIFAKSPVSGAAVSVVGFTLVFGAAVYRMLRTGVGAVPRGQTEAACALGYGGARAFFRIVLPQAVPHILPSYKGEIVALIKATAVVGYIAVQDLTKMGDIVRGRTYEAFFPLIAVAVIYFLLAGVLIFAVNRLENAVNPKRRRDRLSAYLTEQ